MHKVSQVAWSQSYVEIQCREWCWIHAGDHVMNAEWDEEYLVQRWQSNAELWWSRWAEEMKAMSETVDGAWRPDNKAEINGAVNIMSAGQKEQC